MGKFNTVKVGTKTTNAAGGTAYQMSRKLELATLLITSFLSGDKAYETEKDTVKRLTNLYNLLNTPQDKQFFAKAALYARDKFKLRSITHLCSALLAEGIVEDKYTTEDKKWLENYFSRIVMRADDITEIISAYSSRPNCYKSKAGRVQLPNVLKRGFSRAVANYDSYIFAKYKNDSKETSLLDAMVMSHAKATTKNKEGLTALMNKTLKNTTTWEAMQSQAGKASTEEEKAANKEQAWADFLSKGKKIEYFALLRNLRNICETGNSELIDKACTLLADAELVSRSKVLPFRFMTAFDYVNELNNRSVIKALNKAVELSLSNVPEFSGKTAILVDTSGSMGQTLSLKGSTKVIDVAALFAAVFFKANDSIVVPFDYEAHKFTANPDDSLFSIANSLRADGGATNMSAGFNELKESYDRIIVLSDMQTWIDASYYGASCNSAYKKYARTYNPNCKLYTIDLTGNGTLQFPEENVACLGGFSEHIFEIMQKTEEDKRALISEIESINLDE